ncbi:MAG TPA: hypothetical protein VND20_01350 [Candidatus Binataceae bacterium]|nr:hypothetical protein [Candidatus Binataceae bacterium]
MSAQDLNDEPVREDAATDRNDDQDSDLLASKLSKELSNWRRRRTTTGRPRNDDGLSGAFKTDAARTIKVRGHETLVIRKPKLNAKSSSVTTDRGSQ